MSPFMSDFEVSWQKGHGVIALEHHIRKIWGPCVTLPHGGQKAGSWQGAEVALLKHPYSYT